MLKLNELCDELLQYKNILLSAHVAPDPDAIGASCGLALALQSKGIETEVYFADSRPKRMEGLLNGFPISHTLPEHPFDAVVVLDTASKSRISGDGDKLLALSENIINIDHHISNTEWGTVNYIDASAASSSSIVCAIIQELQCEVTETCATVLLAGLMDDTGCFCYSNTNQKAFSSAKVLLDYGAVPEKVATNLYFSIPLNVLTLRALALSKIQLIADGKIGMITVTQAMLKSCGATAEDTEGIIDVVRTVDGTIGAVFARELDDGDWKFSLRSKDARFDVNKLASKFGGGGHKAASGCRLEGRRHEVEKKMLLQIEKAVSLALMAKK